MLASKGLQLCKGSAVAPSTVAKNISVPRARLTKTHSPKLFSQPRAWPSGLLQPSLTPTYIQHAHTTTIWSAIRAYTTTPGTQGDGDSASAPEEIVKAVTDLLGTLAIPGAAKKMLVAWVELNYITLDMLANYADPDEVSRKEHLPRGPFIALVRKAKEMRVSDDVKEAIIVVNELAGLSEGEKMAIVDWMLTNKVTLDMLANYADPDEVSRKEHLPRGPFIALARKAKEMRVSDDVKEAIIVVNELAGLSEGDKMAIVDWMLTNKGTLDMLANYADPDEVSRKEHLPRGPFIALVRKVKESQGPKDLTLDDASRHALALRKWIPATLSPQSTYIRRTGAHEVSMNLVVEQNIKPFLEGDSRANSYRYGVIGGAVGAGKTRMAQEFLANVQEDLKQLHPNVLFSYVRVHLPADDWDPKEPDLALKVTRVLALNLALGHLVGDVTGRSYPSAAQELHALNPLYADLLAVESLIEKSTAQHGPLAKACVILHLDECQSIPIIIKNFILTLQTRLRETRPKIHLLPLFVGLSPSSIVNLRHSSYTGTRIPLPLLDDEDSRALLHDFCSLISRERSASEPSVGWQAYFRKSKHFPQLLRLFAGHPQILRLLARAIVDVYPRNQDHLDEAAAAELLRTVQQHFGQLYHPKVLTNHNLSPHGAATLIKLAFFAESVPTSQKINGLTLEDVEKFGLVSAIPTDPQDPLQVRVTWPLWTYFWLDSHLKLNIFPKQLEETIFRLNSTNLPKLVAHLHLAAIRILTTTSNEPTATTNMRYLYFGQLEAKDDLLDAVVTLDTNTKIKDAYLTHRNPRDKWEPLDPKAVRVITSVNTMDAETVDVTTGRFIIITPPRYPGADVILPYAQEQFKGSLDQDQLEPIPHTKTLKASEVNAEMRKFVVPNLPLIFVSPKPYNGPLLTGNVGFVCGENFFRFTRGFVSASMEQDPSL